MTLRNFLLGGLASVALASASLADDGEDRALVEQAAARRAAAPAAAATPAPAKREHAAAEPAADDLLAQEQQAQAELTLAQVRVELIQARKAYRAGDARTAVQKARAVLARLARLPADVDATQYELQAEGILAKLARDPRSAAALSDGRATTHASDDCDDRPGEHPTTTRVMDQNAVRQNSRERVGYQAELWEKYNDWEADQIVDGDAARMGPPAGEWVQYPDNWSEIVRKRARYAGGLIARGPAVRDGNDREWFTGIYEINDLTYVPPDFQPARGLTPDEELRNQLDRDALRYGSEIFNGFPEDLAAGIPLLRFFGGTDDFALRGPKFSEEKHRAVVELIRAMLGTNSSTDPGGREFEPRIDSIAP